MSIKTNELNMLEHNRDTAVFGQELAKKFNVPRAAIWKVINNDRGNLLVKTRWSEIDILFSGETIRNQII